MKKDRVAIPQELADRVIFAADRTCCVCRQPHRNFQVHHIDEDPSHNVFAKLRQRIDTLNVEIRQHRQPAEELNQEIAAYLGRDELKFKPEQNGYLITRGGQPATDLSDGERTAIAFLYFLKSLKAADFDLTKGIVVIDDPVSSLDANSMFSAFAFLKQRTASAAQLFVLTHNFTFFRQVRSWFYSLPGQGRGDVTRRPARFYMLSSQFDGGHEREGMAREHDVDRELRAERSQFFDEPRLRGSVEGDVNFIDEDQPRARLQTPVEVHQEKLSRTEVVFADVPTLLNSIEAAGATRELDFAQIFKSCVAINVGQEPDHSVRARVVVQDDRATYVRVRLDQHVKVTEALPVRNRQLNRNQRSQ